VSDYFDRVERQIVRNVEAGLPRSTRLPSPFGYLATAAAVAVVIVVAGVFLLAHGSNRSGGPTAGTGPESVTVTFKAAAIDPRAPLGPAIDRSIRILLERLSPAYPGTSVSWNGRDIVVVAPHAGAAARARILALVAPGRLAFYDWEADAIAPNGKTVASQLQAQNPTALQISQGSGSLAPGQTGAGSVPYHRAVDLALTLEKHGRYVVLQAADPSGYRAANFADPSARFYVLRDVPFLTGAGITHPKQGVNASGAPDIEFGFTAAADFDGATKRIAERGDLVSGLGQTFNQHFAVAIDGRLISVPYIDFREYPDGIPQKNGADITGAFTAQSARNLATILRYGPLAVSLTEAG
jgi:hypothetical protein